MINGIVGVVGDSDICDREGSSLGCLLALDRARILSRSVRFWSFNALLALNAS